MELNQVALKRCMNPKILPIAQNVIYFILGALLGFFLFITALKFTYSFSGEIYELILAIVVGLVFFKKYSEQKIIKYIALGGAVGSIVYLLPILIGAKILSTF